MAMDSPRNIFLPQGKYYNTGTGDRVIHVSRLGEKLCWNLKGLLVHQR